MKKLIYVLPALLIATPVSAQSYTTGGGNQGADFTTLSSLPTGSAPADTYEPAEVALPGGVTQSAWMPSTGDLLTTDKANGTTYYKRSVDGGTGTTPIGERKFRTNCEPSTAKQKDNILGFGIPIFGHLHQGYGTVAWDENTTFATSRASPASTCAGGPLNATNYMEPALMITLANGLTVSVRAQDQPIYYTNGNQNETNTATWLRRGMQFVMGGSPTNFNDTARRAIYAAGGFTYPGSPVQPAGFLGWYCSGANVTVAAAQSQGDTGAHITTYARYLRGPAGEDPWGGTCTGTVGVPAQITLELNAPDCWDRYNLTAPDGRAHFWYSSRHSDNTFAGSCPVTVPATSGHAVSDYAHVVTGKFKSIFYTTGFADYGRWYFSSDRMRMATTECPDAASPCDGVSGGNVPATVNGVYYSRVSISDCRKVSADFCNGETGHADYTFGWHSDTFERAERECMGITVRGTAPTDGPAECDGGQVDRSHALLLGTPPDSTYTGGCASLGSCTNATPGNAQRYNPLAAGTAATVTISHTHPR